MPDAIAYFMARKFSKRDCYEYDPQIQNSVPSTNLDVVIRKVPKVRTPRARLKGLTEIERGRLEAAHTKVRPTNVAPYLSPRPDTPNALQYAFYLLGDIRNKTVLDLGCGSGENIAPLLARGANVIGADVSPELVRLARKRVEISHLYPPPLILCSANDVPLANDSIDIILCASLLHHLDIPRPMAEMWRVLKHGGFVIVKEPVRFSRILGGLRSLFPTRKDVSADEHPLTRAELDLVKSGWTVSGERAFRLPWIPLFRPITPEAWIQKLHAIDRMALMRIPSLEHFSTCRVFKLQKPAIAAKPIRATVFTEAVSLRPAPECAFKGSTDPR